MKIRIKAKNNNAEIVLRELSHEKMKGIGKIRFISEKPLIMEISSKMMMFINKKLANQSAMKENVKNTFKAIIEAAGGKIKDFEVSTC